VRKSRKSVKFIAVASTLTLLLAACGGDSASDQPTTTVGSVAPTTNPTGGITAGETLASDRAETWDDDARFSFVYSVDTTGWTPHTITSDNSQIYLYPIYDTLIHINVDASPEPMLATAWELVSPDVLELKLVEGWSFHDGSPFNAEAVKANLEYSKELEGGFTRLPLSILESIEIVDTYTIRLKAAVSAAPLIGILGGAAGMMMSPASLGDESQRVTPTGGSGAFRLVEYVPGSLARYERVDSYWDRDSARISEFRIFISNDDNARLNFVITGEADSTFLRASMLEAAEREDLQVIRRPSLSSYNMGLNPKLVPEFEDPRVRKAITMAIDRKGIGEGLLNGLCAPAHALNPPWYWAGSPEVTGDFYPYDPEQAMALLAEAGASDLTFRLHTVNTGVWPQIAEVLQANFAQVGVTLEVIIEEIGALTTNWRVAKTAPSYLGEQKGAADPSIVTADFFLPTGSQNPGGFSNPDFDRLHFLALEGDSPETRGPVYAELMKLYAEEVAPQITICHITTPFAARPNVQDLPVPSDGTRWFRGVSIAAS